MPQLKDLFYPVDEVAVIDEIQMMRDPERGWAWTRALLGVAAEEVHVCGEASTIQLVQDICSTADETLEVSLLYYHP